jgi:hypothetical protein
MNKEISKNTHVIYHWWCDDPKTQPHQNINYPIILAIASLRFYNKHVEISVLDLSFCDRPKEDWGIFPELFNFKVVKWSPILDLSLPKSSRFCSRVWDIWEYSQTLDQRNILFSDCDVFWFQDPIPFSNQVDGKIENLNCNHNTGLFYFDKKCKKAKDSFDLWKSIISRVLIGDEKHLKEIYEIRSGTRNCFNDEFAFNYLMVRFPEFYKKIGTTEHCFLGSFYQYKNIDKIKNIHFYNASIGQKRGLVFLIIKELNKIKSIFPKNLWDSIFFGKEMKIINLKDITKLSKREIKDIMIDLDSKLTRII